MIVDEEVVAQMKNEMKHVAKSFLIGKLDNNVWYLGVSLFKILASLMNLFMFLFIFVYVQ